MNPDIDNTTGLRCSVRFPLSLPVKLMASAKEYDAFTENISASGVLLHLNQLLLPGTEIDFLIELPEGTTGVVETAAVHCRGRVVRAYADNPRAFAAAVIDEYSFQ